MKSLYKDSNHTIGRYRTVALDPVDKAISGSKGWIFEAGMGLGVVLVDKHGNEKLKYCDYSQLDRWVLRINVLPGLSAHYMNSPNERGVG